MFIVLVGQQSETLAISKGFFIVPNDNVLY